MIQLFRPYLDETEVEAVANVLRSGWIGMGPQTARFEKEFARFIGASYAVGVNSCTAALDLAVNLLDIGAGDEILVPAMTFVSSAHCIVHNLAKPVFVDIDPATLNIDINDVAAKITPRTRAIIAVHYGGRPVEMDSLRRVADGIPIIEDAAHACGAEYNGQKCGTLGDIACFSFHAVKNLTMGDGGMLTLADEEKFKRAKRLRWMGIDRGTWDRTEGDHTYWWEYDVREIGYKCHMNDISAAIGLVQLGKLNKMNCRRAEIANRYTEGLCDLSWLKTPVPDNECSKSSWHIYCIQTNYRDELNQFLRERGVGTGVHYKPIHYYSCYEDRPYLPITEKAFLRILSLPMHPGLTDKDVDYVIDTVRSFNPPHSN